MGDNWLTQHVIKLYEKGSWWIPSTHYRDGGHKIARRVHEEAVELLLPRKDHPAVAFTLSHYDHYLANYESL